MNREEYEISIKIWKNVLKNDYDKLIKEIINLNIEISRLKDKKITNLIKNNIMNYEKDILTNQKMINSIIYILDLN